MNYDQNRMWPGNIQFTQVKRGYSPEEVDRTIRARDNENYILSNQNKALQNEVALLNNTLAQCKEKIQRLVGNMNRIEEERARESLRLANFVTGAGKTADEMIAEAQYKADQIVKNARMIAEKIQNDAETEAKISRNELENLARRLRETRENLNQYFDALDSVLRGAVDSVSVRTSQARPLSAPPPSVLPPDNEEKEDPYEKFLREMKERGDPRGAAQRPTAEPTAGKFLGHFGE